MIRFVSLFVVLALTLVGCQQSSETHDQLGPTTVEKGESSDAPIFQVGQIDIPKMSEFWDVGPAQVVYSDGLLPPQGLFDWYADTGFYQSTDGQPSAMLTADTLIWEDQGTLATGGVRWTLFVTRDGSPVSLDPTQFVEHCIVRKVVEGETPSDPFDTIFLREIPVEGNTVVLPYTEMVQAHTQDLVYFTTTLGCLMKPNTTQEMILISAVLTGVVNPTLAETGQEIEVEIEEHDSLVFYHLPD